MVETLKCPNCEAEIEPDARKCGRCQYYLKSDLESLRSIDRLVGIIERILIWWLVVSFLGATVYMVSRFK
jgi:predicted amidophosphoribosyltransferase